LFTLLYYIRAFFEKIKNKNKKSNNKYTLHLAPQIFRFLVVAGTLIMQSKQSHTTISRHGNGCGRWGPLLDGSHQSICREGPTIIIPLYSITITHCTTNKHPTSAMVYEFHVLLVLIFSTLYCSPLIFFPFF
jgi:hypothetical protein